MNLGGGFFTLGARDKGLMGALGGLQKEFRGLGKEILGLSRIQTMLSAFSFDKLDEMAGKLKGIGSGGIELTGNLQQTFTQLNKSTKSYGAQVGFTGKELSSFTAKASGLAYSLNTDASAAAKAVYGLQAVSSNGVKTSDILEQMGIKGDAAFIKLADQSGVAGDELGYNVAQMASKTGLGAKAVSDLSNMMIQFGMDVADPSQGLAKMNDLTAILEKRTILGDKPEQVEKFAKGIMASANAFYTFTKDGKGAMGAAESLAKALTEGKEGFKNLAMGAANDLPDILKNLSIGGMGASEALKSMSESPEEFLKKYADTLSGIKDPKQLEAAVEFFRAHVSKGFGEAGDLITRMLGDATGRKALKEMDIKALTERSKNAATVIQSGFSDGLTDQDRFERMQQKFDNQLRQLGSVSTKDFLRETGKAMDNFAGMLGRVGRDTGSVSGFIVNKLGDIKKFGATGLFPADMRGPLVATGEAAEALISPLAKLRAAGINVLSPFGALTAVFAGLGAKFLGARAQLEAQMRKSLKATGKTQKQIDEQIAANSASLNTQAFLQVGTSIINFLVVTLPTYANKAVGAVAKFFRNLFSPKSAAPKSASEQMALTIYNLLKDAFKKALAFSKELLSSLWDGLLGRKNADDVINGTDATAIGAGIGIKLREAFIAAKNFVIDYLKNWWKDITRIWSDPQKTGAEKLEESFVKSIPVIGALYLAAEPLSHVFGIVASTLETVWEAGKKVYTVFTWLLKSGEFLWSVMEGLGNILWGTVEVFVQLIGWLTGTTGAVAGLIAAVVALSVAFLVWPEGTQTAVDMMADILHGAGSLLGSALGYAVGYAVKGVGTLLKGLWETETGHVFLGMFNPVTAVLGLSALLLKVYEVFFGFLAKLAPAVADAINGLLQMAGGLINGALEGIRDALVSVFPSAAGEIKAVFDFITGLVTGVVNILRIGFAVVGEVISTLAALISGVFSVLSNIISTIVDVIVTWVLYLVEKIGTGWALLFGLLGDGFAWIGNWFTSTFPGFSEGVGKVFKWIGEQWDVFKDTVIGSANTVIEVVKEIFQGFRDAIGGAFKWINDKIDSIGDALLPKEIVERRKKAKEEEAKKAAAERAAEQAKKNATPKTTPAPSTEPPKTTTPAPQTSPPASPSPTDAMKGLKGGAPGLKLPKLPKMGAGATVPKGALQLPAGMALPTGGVAPGAANAATSTSAKAAVSSQEMSDALIDAVNNPAWVGPYIEMLKKQHTEVMAALRANAPTKTSPVSAKAGAIPTKALPVGASPQPPNRAPGK